MKIFVDLKKKKKRAMLLRKKTKSHITVFWRRCNKKTNPKDTEERMKKKKNLIPKWDVFRVSILGIAASPQE